MSGQMGINLVNGFCRFPVRSRPTIGGDWIVVVHDAVGNKVVTLVEHLLPDFPCTGTTHAPFGNDAVNITGD